MTDAPTPSPPPRAFTQGVGTVFQFVGVILFLGTMLICFCSSLLGKQAIRHDLTGVGWHLPGDPPERPTYSAPAAMTLSVTLGCLLGIAMAGIGLGLQAQRRASPWAAVGTMLLGTLFWGMQTAFAIRPMCSVGFTALGICLTGIFGALLALAVTSLREMLRDPPPRGHELLRIDYQIPYSHLHQDPPEVRLERELEQRRDKLAVQQKELELLEEKLRRSLGGKEK